MRQLYDARLKRDVKREESSRRNASESRSVGRTASRPRAYLAFWRLAADSGRNRALPRGLKAARPSPAPRVSAHAGNGPLARDHDVTRGGNPFLEATGQPATAAHRLGGHRPAAVERVGGVRGRRDRLEG